MVPNDFVQIHLGAALRRAVRMLSLRSSQLALSRECSAGLSTKLA